jgi:putative tricarboxylic transport membrane protein
MHSDETGEDEGRPLVSNRTVEILVALLLLLACGVVIYDSVGAKLIFGAAGGLPSVSINPERFRWQEGLGPGPGYFPFWVALVLGVSSLINLVAAVCAPGPSGVFVSLRPFGRVLAVLIPSFAFVALIEYVGIYVASAIFILAFMLVIGRENFFRALAVAVLVPLALFMMFERWFLVPLPKGPLEAWLGF